MASGDRTDTGHGEAEVATGDGQVEIADGFGGPVFFCEPRGM